MNKELIKQLAQESGFYVSDNVWPAYPDSNIDDQLTNFVKLIGKQLIVQCDNIHKGHKENASRNDGRTSDISFGRIAAADEFKAYVEENFGELK